MARVSIFYDKEEKEQFFMIRGDERYTRSTKTIIEARECTISANGFVQEIFVNVLRDVGDGSLVIYDNDVAVSTLNDWTSTDTGRVIQLPMLAYDVDHNIKVKYIGNSRCSPSMSNTITINQPNTYRTSSSLVFNIGTPLRQLPVPNTTYTGGIILSNDNDDLSLNQNQSLEVYYDDTLIDTITTTASGRANFTYTATETGLHTLYVKFKGTPELYPAQSPIIQLSVGYWFELTKSPVVQVEGDTYTFKGTVHTYFESGSNTGSNVDVTLLSVPNDNIIKTDTSSSTGKVSLSPANTHSDQYRFKMSKNGYDYYSKVYTAPYYTPQSISLQKSTDRMIKGVETLFSMQIDRPLENVPVYFQELKQIYEEEEVVDDSTPPQYQVLSSTKVTTNATGVATNPIIGDGKHWHNYRAKVGNIYSNVITTTGYVVNWSKQGEYVTEGDLSVYYGKDLMVLQDVFRLDSPSDDDLATLQLPRITEENWVMTLLGVSTPYAIRLGFNTSYHNSEGTWNTGYSTFSLTNGVIGVTYDCDTGHLFYDVHNGNNQRVTSGTFESVNNVPRISFRNFRKDSQQVSFRRIYYFQESDP